jgi:hypothetical protein
MVKTYYMTYMILASSDAVLLLWHDHVAIPVILSTVKKSNIILRENIGLQ